MALNASKSPHQNAETTSLWGENTANAINSQLAQTGFQRSQGHSFTATEKLSFDSI